MHIEPAAHDGSDGGCHAKVDRDLAHDLLRLRGRKHVADDRARHHNACARGQALQCAKHHKLACPMPARTACFSCCQVLKRVMPASSAASSKVEKPTSSSQSSSSSKVEKTASSKQEHTTSSKEDEPATSKEEKPASSKTEASASKEAAN